MKNLSMQIAEHELSENVPRRVNKAAFIIVRDDVKRALDNGWPVRAIWRTLHNDGRIAFSYDIFRRLVKRLIRARQSEIIPNPPTSSNSSLTSGDTVPKQASVVSQCMTPPTTVKAVGEQVRGTVPHPGGDQVANMAVIGGQSLLDAVKEFAHLVSRFPEETLFIVHVWVPSGTDPALLSH